MKSIALAITLFIVFVAHSYAKPIHRLILFTLNESVDSEAFKKETLKLASADGVDKFKWLDLKKNKLGFEYGVEIVFADKASEQAYVQC